MPVAPRMRWPMSGESSARRAASRPRVGPLAMPMPISAEPDSLHDRAHVGEVEVDQARAA